MAVCAVWCENAGFLVPHAGCTGATMQYAGAELVKRFVLQTGLAFGYYTLKLVVRNVVFCLVCPWLSQCNYER